MTGPLFEYVSTLPEDVKRLVSIDMKDKRVISILSEADIDVPQEVLKEIDALYAEVDRHDSIMESMCPYLSCSCGKTPTSDHDSRKFSEMLVSSIACSHDHDPSGG